MALGRRKEMMVVVEGEVMLVVPVVVVVLVVAKVLLRRREERRSEGDGGICGPGPPPISKSWSATAAVWRAAAEKTEERRVWLARKRRVSGAAVMVGRVSDDGRPETAALMGLSNRLVGVVVVGVAERGITGRVVSVRGRGRGMTGMVDAVAGGLVYIYGD